jgi:hypothetical protein
MSRLDELQHAFQIAAKNAPLSANTSGIVSITPSDPDASAANIRRLREIIAQYGWPTISMVGVRGASAAAMIVFTARNDSDLQSEALRLMEPLVKRDEVPATYYASMFDVVHTNQRFGMVNECVHGMLLPSKPIEDPEHLDARRATLGLPKLPKFCVSPAGIDSGR